MKWLNLNLPSPPALLAADEALLDWCENGCGEETLMFWEPQETFVVVGYANKVGSEVNVAACAARRIPIFRRCSGGGTVLQAPGCLNYSLILRHSADGPLRNVTAANRFIMEHNRTAIESLVPKTGVAVCGHTDLAISGRKFSGNSQRRKQNFLLFHGAFLLHLNLALVGEFLKLPSLQPDYRSNRSHDDFLVNLNLSAAQVKAAMQKTWNATGELQNFPEQEIQRLAQEKYSTDAWNLKL